MVKVSVVIPIYGVERYIHQTLTSVLNQTFEDFEVILVDDESPDRSIEICQGFTDPRLQIIHQKNRGLAGARNSGIRQAQGEYIALLDGDDLWEPEKLARHVAHLEANPDVGLSFSPSAFIDPDGQANGSFLSPKLTGIRLEDLFRQNPVGNGSAPVLRRSMLAEIAFPSSHHRGELCYFDEDFRRSEDIECWIRICAQTPWKMEGIPAPLTLYRINAQGLSASLLKQLDSWHQVLGKIHSYDPQLVQQWGGLSVAYRCRMLARQALRLRDGKLALELCQQALRSDWRILRDEPLRTMRVLCGAALLCFLPGLYARAEAIALQLTHRPQRHLSHEN